ncbi:MAG: helix-turn-helix transcriptional regulator [Bacillota bacterium]
MSLGENIYKLRKERKWSQDKLGKMVKIDGRQICRYEKENSVPSAETLRKLAEVFGVTVDYLLSANPDSELGKPQIKDPELFDFFREIDQMGPKERSAIKFVLETFVNNNRAKRALETNKTND